jgi:hypothetical protein
MKADYAYPFLHQIDRHARQFEFERAPGIVPKLKSAAAANKQPLLVEGFAWVHLPRVGAARADAKRQPIQINPNFRGT